jgi:UPF0716 family protein affecting phage T7 exclusion
MPASVQKIIAEWRNRIETTVQEITDQMELARHGAHTFWRLLTRTAAAIAARTLVGSVGAWLLFRPGFVGSAGAWLLLRPRFRGQRWRPAVVLMRAPALGCC